jgi:RNA polymerase sigma-70 factor (ECF subfamily)
MAGAAPNLVIGLRGGSILQVARVGSSVSRDRGTEIELARALLTNLYEEYYDRIVRYIFVRISDQTEAEDLAGEVFLKALKSLNSYRGRGEQMHVWLFKIARNTVVDHVRKMSKRKTVALGELEISDELSVEETVETKLQVERLSKALRQLTPSQREVIGLRFFAGLSSAEVGEILGKSGGAVREMQRAAIEKLRKLIW